MSNPGATTFRQELAKSIRKIRRSERFYEEERFAYKRNRSLTRYLYYLQGLGATLNYIRRLPSPCLVDLGSGTGRAIKELSTAEIGRDLTIIGTGIAWHKYIEYPHYRITPAECMRGFKPSSVGGFISVFGPTHYSYYLKVVLDNLDRVLIPGGVMKLVMMEHSSFSRNNAEFTTRLSSVTDYLKTKGYGLAVTSHTARTSAWEVTFCAIVAIKGGTAIDHEKLASDLIDGDYQTFPKDLSPIE